ncbi:MAG: glycoside-pentoside-hexuronide (GPH):cation symporter [Dehalococcoidia bacterium]
MKDIQQVSNVNTVEGSERLSLGVKLGYGIGNFAFNLAFQVVALFLIFFYTDVFMISAAFAGAIFFVSKAWDIVFDPMVGYFCDHTKSRWGKKRPYILFGSILLGISMILLFASPNLSETDRIIYGFVTFIAFCSAITVANVPYGSLTADLTLDAHERSSLSGYSMAFALAGTLAAAGATKLLVGSFADETTGFRAMGIIYAVIVVVLLMITFASVKERGLSSGEVKQPLKKDLALVVKNGPFLILTGATTLMMVGISIVGVVVNYYFKYNLQMEWMIPIAFLLLFVTAGIFLPLFVFISKKKSKKFAFNTGLIIFSIALVLLYFFSDKGIEYIIPILFLAGVGMATVYLSPWSMIPDTVEFSQWKTGLRREGILYGCFWVSFKIGAALAGFIAGQCLTLANYIPNIAQSEGTLFMIKLLMTAVPLIFILATIALISFYPINAEMHRKMLDEIKSGA